MIFRNPPLSKQACVSLVTGTCIKSGHKSNYNLYLSIIDSIAV